MSRHTFDEVLPELRKGIRRVAARPGLLYDQADLEAMRARMATMGELRESTLSRAREIVRQGDLSQEPGPYYNLGRVQAVVAAQMLEPSDEFAAHILRLLRAVGEESTWICHVHPGMKCDHCTANVVANVALAMEALGEALSEDDERLLTERAHQRCLAPFLDACRNRSEFWSRRDHQFNWRIMTCGETGLGALGLDAPDRQDVVEFATEGVADILDRVPPDGDWEEGPGYWAGTLFMGLRLALALRRATDGRVNLFEHPALKATADYLKCVTLPDGSVLNYADNSPRIGPTPLHLMARELRDPALAWTARRMGHRSLWDVLFDDPALPAEEPPAGLRCRVFTTTGIALTRTDWSEEATFVALKSGPTAVGHSHLDINSFTVSKGSARLLIDPGIWPYAGLMGFFDSGPGGRRWDYDANATVAHNTVLVDGQGQTCGPECGGRLVAHGCEGSLSWFVSEAAEAYPGLVTGFRRWLVHAAPDVVLVYDELASDPRDRRWQWLLHVAGEAEVTRTGLVVRSEGRVLSLARLLPGPDAFWRNVQETRTSYYEDSDALKDTEQTIRLHRFGPMLASQEIEFLWAMHLGEPPAMSWSLERAEGAAELIVRGEGEIGEVAVRLDRSAPAVELLAP